VNNEDLAKLRRAINSVMARLGMLLGPMLPRRLLQKSSTSQT
jgi:hypothetical protein